MEFCPECGGQVIFTEGCLFCPACGWSACNCEACNGTRKEKAMIYYWIRKEDLKGQEIVDEVDINDEVAFVKVKEVRGEVFYHEEVGCSALKKKLQTA